jgi:hypothetical protein
MNNTFFISGCKLATLYDNDMALYHTPGSDNLYWASSPNFTYDRCVATIYDVLKNISKSSGYSIDIDDLRNDYSIYDFNIITE